jgi:hypothetical protein
MEGGRELREWEIGVAEMHQSVQRIQASLTAEKQFVKHLKRLEKQINAECDRLVEDPRKNQKNRYVAKSPFSGPRQHTSSDLEVRDSF